MSEKFLILTPRNLYTLLSGKLEGFRCMQVFSAEALRGMKLTRLWQDFLRNIVPEDVLYPMFDTSERRRRSLSVLMNRNTENSCPRKLYAALEEHLNAEAILRAAVWWDGIIAPLADPWAIHDMLMEFERACEVMDTDFARCSGVLDALRQNSAESMEMHDRVRFGCTLRLTWLGLFAIYGGRMVASRTLSRLRTSGECSPVELWRRAYCGYLPKRARQGTSYAERPLDRTVVTMPLVMESGMQKDAASALKQGNQGWYVVSNWSDPMASLNNRPCPSFNGSRQLALIPNGAQIYIAGAPYYKGLGNSRGSFGLTLWNGICGYVPMNYLTRLNEQPPQPDWVKQL